MVWRLPSALNCATSVNHTMVVVAIAGGTGAVGRTVLDAIAKAGEHDAIVLSRTVSLSNAALPI